MIFNVGGVELDTELFSVTREGQPVSVEPKVFDLLVFLIRHRDRLITRDQLFDELWPDRVVSDNVLSNEIKLARAVLGDDGNQQKYIRTVRGRASDAPAVAAPQKPPLGKASVSVCVAGLWLRGSARRVH